MIYLRDYLPYYFCRPINQNPDALVLEEEKRRKKKKKKSLGGHNFSYLPASKSWPSLSQFPMEITVY